MEEEKIVEVEGINEIEVEATGAMSIFKAN